MISIDLDREHCRIVTIKYITNTLIIQKQYLNDTQIAKYKFMLNEFATLCELDAIIEKFNRAWPTDVTW